MDKTWNPLLVWIGLLTALLPTTCLFLSVNILFFVPLVIGIGSAAVGCVKMPESVKPRAAAIGLIVCVVASLGPSALAAYFNRPGNPIKIVLPVGFRGEFSIVKNPATGQDLKLEDSVWVFKIPPSGVLVVNDDYPFHMWHQAIYVYTDGHGARVESLGSGESTNHEGTTYFWKMVDAP
jgi:hypothetical protein